MANSKIQMVGSEQELSKGPDDMRQSAFPGGMVQMTGSDASLSRRTTPMGVFDKHISGGMTQTFATTVDLNRTAHRGWDSYDTPMSDNSETPDSSMSGFPSGGSK